ncbi:MAG: hypothetical protein GY862_03290 [Gammaproteobacteria bacterium]|nr:hypothetical protein [Gammaproteobacteria bacterium]
MGAVYIFPAMTLPSEPAGIYSNSLSVNLSCIDCADIYYTLNGPAPTIAASLVYTGPIPITDTTILKYFSTGGPAGPETVTEIKYVIDTVPPAASITAPEDGAVLTEAPLIEGIASDADSGGGVDQLAYVELAIQDIAGGKYVKLDEAGVFGGFIDTPVWIKILDAVSWKLDTSTVAFVSGNDYRVTARAVDLAGNVSEETSIQFTYFTEERAFTTLYLESNSAAILNDGVLDISGRLNRYPYNGEDLSGLGIELEITAPDGSVRTEYPVTNTDTGQYQLSGLSGFAQEGLYTLQAFFKGTPFLLPSKTAPRSVLVGQSAGYALLIQGKIANNEGVEAHNKTTNRIYRKLKERGFEDENIFYFNYDPSQTGVDGIPDKNAIQTAFGELQGRINGSPAPLYVIMVDHGGITGSFHVDNGSYETITPPELSGWLTGLENALAKPRIAVIGSCYSGAFIPALSAPGRIVITSAAANEESYKGLMEEKDGIRSGEFFMEELFHRLGRGDSLRAAFEEATARTEIFTRQGGGDGDINRYQDDAVQHPLLDDNGDGKGSNVLYVNTGEGLLAERFYLGAGLNFDTNAADNPADILAVPDTVFLAADQSWADMLIAVNDAGRVNSASVDIRKPAVVLVSDGTEHPEQLEIEDLHRAFLSCSRAAQQCAGRVNGFDEPGRYDAFYFVRDRETDDISPVRHSLVYKDRPGNRAPDAFNLLAPKNGTSQKIALILDWETAGDPDGEPVTYTLLIAKNADFVSVIHAQTDLSYSMAAVDIAAGLEINTAYFWKVIAVDHFGARTESTEVFSFTTNDPNAPPNIGTVNLGDSGGGVIYSPLTGTGDNIIVRDIPEQPGIFAEQGQHLMALPGDSSYTLDINMQGYYPETAALDLTQGSMTINVPMTPPPPPPNPGQLQFSGDSVRVNENEGGVTVFVERILGYDGPVAVSYSAENGAAVIGDDYESVSGTLTWADQDRNFKPITLAIIDDAAFEGDKSFTLSLSSPLGGAGLGRSSLEVTIADDEAPVPGVLGFANASVTGAEGESVQLDVTRTLGCDGEVSVRYAGMALNSTAVASADYTGGNGILTWTDGECASKPVVLSLQTDSETESMETVSVELSEPAGGAIAGALKLAFVNISDVPPPPSPRPNHGRFQFEKTAYSVSPEFRILTLSAGVAY